MGDSTKLCCYDNDRRTNGPLYIEIINSFFSNMCLFIHYISVVNVYFRFDSKLIKYMAFFVSCFISVFSVVRFKSLDPTTTASQLTTFLIMIYDCF